MTRTSPNGDGGSKDEGIQEQQTLVAAPTPRPDNAAAQQQTSDDRAPLQAVSAEAHALEPPADDDPGMVPRLCRASINNCLMSHTASCSVLAVVV